MMLSLPAAINTRCSQLLLRCDQFASQASLRALFVTPELSPFRDRLPEATGGRHDFISLVIAFLLSTRLADGRVLLLPFLEALREQYAEEDQLHSELGDLYKQVLNLPAAISPAPIGLNRSSMNDVTRDGTAFTPARRRHLERRRDDLADELALRGRKLAFLRNARAVEAGAAQQFQLDAQIADERKAISDLEQELEQIERDLGQG